MGVRTNLAEQRPSSGPYVVEEADYRNLHFDETLVQSRMSCVEPDRLVVEYTRAMMAFLLYTPAPRSIALIGLGGGSLVKYCRRHLPAAQFTAVEISEEVLALRAAFGVPPDGPGLAHVHADGAAYLRSSTERFDVLLVDGFDASGPAPSLCTPAFYEDCRARLTERGVLVVNISGYTAGYGETVRRIRDAFAPKLVTYETQDAQNKLVFAWRGPSCPPEGLIERAEPLEARHGLGLIAVARKLAKAHARRPQPSPG